MKVEVTKVKKPRNVVFIVLGDDDYVFWKKIADEERTSVPRVARAALAARRRMLENKPRDIVIPPW